MLLSRWSIWSIINPKERSMCCTKAIVGVYTFLWRCAGQVSVLPHGRCYRCSCLVLLSIYLNKEILTGAQEPRCDHWGQAESISGFRFCVEICREWCSTSVLFDFCNFPVWQDEAWRFGCVPMDGEVLCPAGLRFKVRHGDVPLLHRSFSFQAVQVFEGFLERFFMLKFLVLDSMSMSCCSWSYDWMLRGQWTFRHYKDVIEPEMRCGSLGVLIFLEWGLFGRMWSSQTLTWEKQLLISFDIKKHFVFSSIWVVLLEF